MTAQKRRPSPAEIIRQLDKTARGDAILTPEACADWLPCMNDGPAAEAWANAFEEQIVGMEAGSSPAMNKRTRAQYFRALKAFQLAFWREHAGEIMATLDAELIAEYD